MGQQNPAPVENGGKHPIIYRLSTIPGAFRNHPQLVGGLEHEFYDFPYIGNFIIPIDELHHFSEG